MLGASVTGGVGAGASWPAKGLVGGGSEVTMGCTASRFGTAVVVLKLS